MIINQKGTRIVKDGKDSRITNNEIETFRQNFSR